MKTAVFIRAASDDDNECLETDGLMEMVELVGNDGNKNEYQHLLLVLEQEMPNDETRCHVKYANLIMNRFSIRASDRVEVCGIQTVQVPNLGNSGYRSSKRENDVKERKRVAGRQARVRNIIFKIIFRVFIF